MKVVKSKKSESLDTTYGTYTQIASVADSLIDLMGRGPVDSDAEMIIFEVGENFGTVLEEKLSLTALHALIKGIVSGARMNLS